MTCSDWQDRFSDIYEGRGDQALEAAFGDHLRRCAACRAAYAEFEAAWYALDSLADAEPAELPPGFHVNLLARIEEEQIERALARKKSLRARLRDLFSGSRSPRTTFAYAAVAVGIALCVILIPNPLRESGARLLGFGPDTSVVEPVTKPAGAEEPGSKVDEAPEPGEEQAQGAMPQSGEPEPSVEIGWGTSAGAERSVITLTNHGTEPLNATVELLAGISPSPSPTTTTRDAMGSPGPIWKGPLTEAQPVRIRMPDLRLPDGSAAHLVLTWGRGNEAYFRHIFIPIEAGGAAGAEPTIALPDPDMSRDHALGCIAAQAGLLIVCDQKFDEPVGLPTVDQEQPREGLGLSDALSRVRPPGFTYRIDNDKQIVYIEGNED